MIISDPYRFLFVANLRTASESIQTALESVATVNVARAAEGKHMTLGEIYAEYAASRIDPLFKWAVIREPTAYLWSLYQLHMRPAFAGEFHSTVGMTFEEFCGSDTHAWMLAPQSSRFVSPGGDYGLDFLITMERLVEGFGYVKFRLGLPNVLLPVTNVTEHPPDVPDALRDRIRDEYADDYACIARYGNRERTADGFHLILQPSQPAGAG